MSYKDRGRNTPMVRADREVKKKELIAGMLEMIHVAVIGVNDEEYPYLVPMNFGYEWAEDPLVLYVHCGRYDGQKRRLFEKNPKVAVQLNIYLERYWYEKVRGEEHDYRSVNVYGTIEEVTDKEEFKRACDALQKHNERPANVRATDSLMNRMCIYKITAEEITAKSQYPIHSLAEVPFPELGPRREQ